MGGRGARHRQLRERTRPGAGATHLLGVSEFLSYNQWVSLWSAHTGVKTQFHNVPVELFTADDPSGLKRTMADVMKSIEEFGYTGGDPDVITPDEVSAQCLMPG